MTFLGITWHMHVGCAQCFFVTQWLWLQSDIVKKDEVCAKAARKTSHECTPRESKEQHFQALRHPKRVICNTYIFFLADSLSAGNSASIFQNQIMIDSVENLWNVQIKYQDISIPLRLRSELHRQPDDVKMCKNSIQLLETSAQAQATRWHISPNLGKNPSKKHSPQG